MYWNIYSSVNLYREVLKRFNMHKAYPLSTPIVVRTFDVQKDPFRPPAEREIILGP